MARYIVVREEDGCGDLIIKGMFVLTVAGLLYAGLVLAVGGLLLIVFVRAVYHGLRGARVENSDPDDARS